MIFGIEVMPGTGEDFENLKWGDLLPVNEAECKFQRDESNPCAGEAVIGDFFFSFRHSAQSGEEEWGEHCLLNSARAETSFTPCC